MSHASHTPRGVYLITPDETDTARLLARVYPLLAETTWLQYRSTVVDAATRRVQAQALQALCMEAGVPLLINGDAALAAEIGAAGVHLGEDSEENDDDITAARALLGPDAIIGASCYDQLALAQQAVAVGASYVSFGAFFPSPSKVTTHRAQPQLLRDAATLGVPRVAIGGLTADNIAPLVEAGADLVAVISGVFATEDPVAAMRAYQASFA